ncbi:hypothetical protein ACJQWK_02004 [Exserohilum turcicum]
MFCNRPGTASTTHLSLTCIRGTGTRVPALFTRGDDMSKRVPAESTVCGGCMNAIMLLAEMVPWGARDNQSVEKIWS